MQRNTQLLFGGIVIGIGLLVLISAIFDISLWAVCFPIGLILFGLWILFRPRMLPDNSDFRIKIFGDIKRRGIWEVIGEEILMFIGDVRLDFTEAEVPPGETNYRFIAFIGDIRLKIPQDVSVSVSSMAFLTELRINGKKSDHFLIPIDYKSDGYEEADRIINLQTVCFIGDVRIDEVETKVVKGAEVSSEAQ